jgi:predicted deacetylase
MIPSPAQYLLRFDDLCPTISRIGWERFLPLIEEFGVRPILAVVPDNQDPELEVAEPDPEFWSQMRRMEAAGATIGLHGYRHLCRSRGRSLLPLHFETEFAGVVEQTQREWIRDGLGILRGHGLNPQIWVAPRHGFDENTLRVLREERIVLLSDGFARGPFTRGGLTWIPQQLWEPVEKSKGLWTICLHSNTATDALVGQLKTFLRQHTAQFTSVDRVVADLLSAGLIMTERLYEEVSVLRFRGRRKVKRLLEHFRE